MKLRNKKTGEIRDFIINKDKIQTASAIDCWEYSSLAELNEEWEDVPEEPAKPYWFINDLDGEPMKCDLKNCGKSNFIEWSKHRKKIGNYFETKEEAEKAVEKLKAWKRMKDNGFEFDGIRLEGSNCLIKTKLKDNTGVTFHHAQQFYEDVDLLFGGEE